MPAKKKYTQSIFDDLKTHPGEQTFGYLSLMYEVFDALTETRSMKKKLTQQALAKKSGIAQPTIARIEAGRANPTLLQVVKLAHALDLKIKFEETKYTEGDYEGYLEKMASNDYQPFASRAFSAARCSASCLDGPEPVAT